MVKGQSKRLSIIEALVNTAIGFGISLSTWIVIQLIPWFDFEMSMGKNLIVTGIFTVISIIRGYWVRRGFNHWDQYKVKHGIGVPSE